METITITAKYTDTKELLMFFAIEKGWRPTVKQLVEKEGKQEEVEIPNPVTLEQFITDWANKMLKDQIGDPAKEYIRKQAQAQIQKEEQRIDEELGKKLEITVE